MCALDGLVADHREHLFQDRKEYVSSAARATTATTTVPITAAAAASTAQVAQAGCGELHNHLSCHSRSKDLANKITKGHSLKLAKVGFWVLPHL